MWSPPSPRVRHRSHYVLLNGRLLPIVEDVEGRPLPDFYGRPRCTDPLLFDLRSDSLERHTLSSELPNELAELLGTLKEWRTEMASITGEPDPIQGHGLSLPYSRFMERMLARR